MSQSHYAYVIANTAEEADEKVRTYILATHTDRWIYERWSLCFKGEPDAREMLREQLPNKPNARLWKVALTAEPVDVPRETSVAPEGGLVVWGYSENGAEVEVAITRDRAAELVSTMHDRRDVQVIGDVYVRLGAVADELERTDVPRETSLGDCPDCQVSPGEPHSSGCDRARCTVCGEQRITCKHGDGDEGWHEIYVPRETPKEES